MKLAIDTNVISALWSQEASANRAHELLSRVRREGSLIICGPVYSELIAYPGATAEFVDRFLRAGGIEIDLEPDLKIWQVAGVRFAEYAIRRRESGGNSPRRLLADFVIGAHAVYRADGLLSFNETDYRIAYPELRVIS